MAKVLFQIRRHPHTFGGESHAGWLPAGAATPQPTPVRNVLLDLEIVQEDPGSFLLNWTGLEAGFHGDTWHRSVREAMDQAELAFGIEPSEWSPAPT
jgi:hypothetical protein